MRGLRKIGITHRATNDLSHSLAAEAADCPGFAAPARAFITHKETNDFVILFPSGKFSSFSLGKIPELTVSEASLCNLFIYNRLRSIFKNYPPSHDWFPPYNTGKKFVYNDNFTPQNNKENKHVVWLNMMFPRLLLARELLSDKGVIMISIDDKEVHNLRLICDEVFGENNFITQCVRKRRCSQANLSTNISPVHEYLVIYAKKKGKVLNHLSDNNSNEKYRNPDGDPRGPYVTRPCTNKGGKIYTITTPTGKKITDEWRFAEKTYQQLFDNGRIFFPKNGDGKPRYKTFLSEKIENGVLANTWLEDKSSNNEAVREIKKLFGDTVFDTPKPLGLLEFCLDLASEKDSVILDFFSSSATTAHAVMRKNAIDGGQRKYIMIQTPEETNPKSIANKKGYKTICEIGEERIRRAGKQIMDETHAEINYGFRVYTLSK